MQSALNTPPKYQQMTRAAPQMTELSAGMGLSD